MTIFERREVGQGVKVARFDVTINRRVQLLERIRETFVVAAGL
jgi:hypothetical protein